MRVDESAKLGRPDSARLCFAESAFCSWYSFSAYSRTLNAHMRCRKSKSAPCRARISRHLNLNDGVFIVVTRYIAGENGGSYLCGCRESLVGTSWIGSLTSKPNSTRRRNTFKLVALTAAASRRPWCSMIGLLLNSKFSVSVCKSFGRVMTHSMTERPDESGILTSASASSKALTKLTQS